MELISARENGAVENGLGGNNKCRTDSQLTHMGRSKKYVYACSVIASLNSAFLGYDTGVISGAILFIHEDLKISEVQEEILIGILSVMSLLGSLAGGRTSDAIGRKWTMALTGIVFQAGAVVMAVAPSFPVLIIGRILAGIGVGFGNMIAPVYIAEIAPTSARGSLASFPEIFANSGVVLGYVSSYALSGLPAHINWRIMLAVGILPSVFLAIGLFVIPESPRWLVMQNRVDEARQVLLKTSGNEGVVEERLAEIQLAAGHGGNNKLEQKGDWLELLHPSPALRRMLIAALGIHIFQQITGVDVTLYYSPEIFKAAGTAKNSKLLAATIGVGVVKTTFILITIFLVDKVGRKPLLYISTMGMTACLFGIGATLLFIGQGSVGFALAILLVCGNAAFFSAGMGPVSWVVTSEILPLRVRAQATALGSICSRLCSGVIAMSFLSASRAITMGGVFFIFSAISVLSVAFVYKCVPETKGKSLEQIEVMFQDGDGYELRGRGSEVQRGEVQLQHVVSKEFETRPISDIKR